MAVSVTSWPVFRQPEWPSACRPVAVVTGAVVSMLT